MSKAEKFLKSREAPPIVSPQMIQSVSQFRRGGLEDEVDMGRFRESASQSNYIGADMGPTAAGFVKSSSNANPALTKMAQQFGGGGGESDGGAGGGYRGSGGTVRQTPEVYSPLWLNSNLNLPRDRATINAWSRSFFALNPMVQNAITLHSTYPISKLNIKCKSGKAKKFFETMIEEIDLMNICVQIAQEYWTLGEAFVYAELDEGSAKWSRFFIKKTKYIKVNR